MGDWNEQAARNNHDRHPHKEEKNKEIQEKMIQMDVQEELKQELKK